MRGCGTSMHQQLGAPRDAANVEKLAKTEKSNRVAKVANLVLPKVSNKLHFCQQDSSLAGTDRITQDPVPGANRASARTSSFSRVRLTEEQSESRTKFQKSRAIVDDETEDAQSSRVDGVPGGKYQSTIQQ